MNYSQIKKLDEDTQRNLQEGSGPVSECLCTLLAPPDEPKGFRGSIKRALASMGGRRSGGKGGGKGGVFATSGGNAVEIPLTFDKGGKGVYTTKEEIKRNAPCGKCGCDKEKMFMKTSFANIRITSPDISSICPCPNSSCMPGKDKLNNNISVTVERVGLSDVDTDDENGIDRKTDEKTTQVRNRLKIPSVNDLPTEKSFLEDQDMRPSSEDQLKDFDSPKDQVDISVSSTKTFVKEKQKTPTLRELDQAFQELIEADLRYKKEMEPQWGRNQSLIAQRRKLEEINLNTEKTAKRPNYFRKNTMSRPEDQNMDFSESFSRRMEEEHEDVMKRHYH